MAMVTLGPELAEGDTTGLHGAFSQRVAGSAFHAKEFGLLAYILAQVCPGDPAAACAAMEHFAEEMLWLKIMGGAKADVLAVAMRRAPLGGRLLEIGTYCGYSAMRMAIVLSGAQIRTLEIDPVHVLIARRIITFTGLAGFVRVQTGHSKDLLPRLATGLGDPGFGTVFMDHRCSCKEGDLSFLERSGLLQAGAAVIADNVLKPGAPLFLWHVVKGAAYKTQVVHLIEFAMPLADWLSLSVWCTADAAIPPCPEPPP